MEKITIANDILLPEVKRLVDEGLTVKITARGNSMLPFVRDEKDSLVLGRAEDFGVGDVVLAEIAPGRYVVHRIIAEGEGGRLTLMGDGNLKGTESCLRDNVMAKVVEILRNGKRKIVLDTDRFRRLSRIWMALKPFRRIILGIRRRIV